jgi:hypothetical protein
LSVIPLAVDTGAILVSLAIVLIVLALAYGFTKRGSGISAHPHTDQQAPGGEEEAIDRETVHQPASTKLDQRGTR